MSWKLKDNRWFKTYELSSFDEVIELLNQLKVVANEANHHPDFKVHDYKYVSFELFTHDKNQVTKKDYELAERIDELVQLIKR